MKIILAHYKYYIQGGPERYMFKFSELAEKHGAKVIPFSVDYPENVQTPYSKYFVKPTAEKAEYGKGKLSIAKIIKDLHYQYHNREAYKNLKRLIKDEKPDLLYCLIPGMLSADIFKAAHEEGVPIIIRISDYRLICGNNVLLRDGEICEECICGKYGRMVRHKCVRNSYLFSIIRALELTYQKKRKTYKYIDAVITPPEFTRNKFIESGYFPTDIMFINPTFVEVKATDDKNDEEKYALCLGRYSAEKGFYYAFEAMQYLLETNVSLYVTSDRDNCDDKAKAFLEDHPDIDSRVKFVGFLHGKELEDITQKAMCVLCPSIVYDNMPNVVLEAYSFGRPVVATDLGPLSEIVENGKTGILCQRKDSKSIANGILQLYENPEYCAELGRNARKKCETDFSPEAHWNKFMEIYNGIKKA